MGIGSLDFDLDGGVGGCWRGVGGWVDLDLDGWDEGGWGWEGKTNLQPQVRSCEPFTTMVPSVNSPRNQESPNPSCAPKGRREPFLLRLTIFGGDATKLLARPGNQTFHPTAQLPPATRKVE